MKRGVRSRFSKKEASIDQETRLYDANKKETRPMRTKEEAHDYRYFPDPDLLPLEFDQAYVEALKKKLPELPDEKKARFMRDFSLSAYDAGVLVAERETAELFRSRRQRTRRQVGGELGDQRVVRAAEQGRQGSSHRRRYRPASLARCLI